MKARTVDEAQLGAITGLYRRVAAIADGLGSENTDSGQVIPTTLRTFRGAVRAHFPRTYETTPLARADFDDAFGQRPGVPELVAELVSFELGFVAAPGAFQPGAQSRGVFWICLFARSEAQTGRNVLVRFQRVET